MARSHSLGLGVTAASLAAATAFVPIPNKHSIIPEVGHRSSFVIAPAFVTPSKSSALAVTTDVLSEDQTLHTAERLSGMSRGEIQHIFEDLDADGSGSIDLAELDLLAKYFPGETFTVELREKLMKEIDTDGSGDVSAEEFYKWMVVNAKSGGMADETGTKKMEMRMNRLEVGRDGIDDHLIELLEEVCLFICVIVQHISGV
jgi:hypothetical protein